VGGGGLVRSSSWWAVGQVEAGQLGPAAYGPDSPLLAILHNLNRGNPSHDFSPYFGPAGTIYSRSDRIRKELEHLADPELMFVILFQIREGEFLSCQYAVISIPK
jgi:hypothetical protein